MKWKRFFSCLLCGVLLLCGCTPAANSATTSHQLELVTTLFCYYDFARAILKDTDTIHLRLLLSPGMESHSFEPAPSDILAIQNADLFLYNGGHMEEWVSQVLDSDEQSHPDRIVRCMMDYAPLLEEVEYDEHIWTSPVIAKDLLYVTRDAIIQADPANAAIYQKNADAYAAQLDALNESFTDYFAEPEHRTLLFADKFPLQYFANTYGLHCYAAFSGCSSDTEPSIATISNLMHLVESDHLSKVYYLEVSSPAVANVIGEQTGATPTVFQSCHTLTQTDFDNGETYVSLMQRNLKALESQ